MFTSFPPVALHLAYRISGARLRRRSNFCDSGGCHSRGAPLLDLLLVLLPRSAAATSYSRVTVGVGVALVRTVLGVDFPLVAPSVSERVWL